MTLRRWAWALLTCSVATTLPGQEYGFTLVSPAAGDTFSVGDTVRIVWEHDSTWRGFTQTYISDDAGEFLRLLAWAAYPGWDTVAVTIRSRHTEYAETTFTVQHPGDGSITAGWNWIVTDSVEGYPVHSGEWWFVFQDFLTERIVIVPDPIYIVSTNSSAQSAILRPRVLSALRTVWEYYDLSGRLLHTGRDAVTPCLPGTGTTHGVLIGR